MHFHGGLVNRSAGEGIAKKLAPIYGEKGASSLFFVWQSGWDEAIKYNLDEAIRSLISEIGTDTVKGVLKKGLKVAADHLGIYVPDGILGYYQEKVSDSEIDSEIDARFAALEDGPLGFAVEVPSHEPFEEASKMADRKADVDEDFVARLQQELEADPEVAALEDDGTLGFALSLKAAVAIAKIVYRTIKRFVQERDHGLYLTVLEETLVELGVAKIGQILEWDLMKQDAADAFGPEAASYPGTALLQAIKDVGMTQKRRVILVGHSTGAVYICRLLQACQGAIPDSIQFDILFLAPACTFRLMDETFSVAGGRIRSLGIFGMSDEVECADRVVPPIYTRSLLYLVSGILEPERDMPLLGMQRFHQSTAYKHDPAVMSVRERLAPYWKVWSVTGGTAAAGQQSASRSHGDFDDDPETLESLAHWINATA
ncbi:MAG: hypothetical protein GC165_07560 [Armatimonadetes bacterium]|nr:hypothetical protein [Armatimonadota bacterium]